jgi:DNA-directed RNA polymerase specialized sigma24 family protein
MMRGMEPARREQLARIMAAIPHDEAAVVTLFIHFGDDIGRVVHHLVLRHLASRPGRRLPDDEVDDLTLEACFELARVAGGWRADGGALPWVWARARIERVVADHFGPLTVPLADDDDLAATGLDRAAAAAVHDDGSFADALATLAEGDSQCALLLTAIDEQLGRDEAEVLFRYRVQQQAGDPSPAHTVGHELGLRPPTVRKRVSRARQRLADAVATDPRFASLDGLALLVA